MMNKKHHILESTGFHRKDSKNWSKMKVYRLNVFYIVHDTGYKLKKKGIYGTLMLDNGIAY